MMTLKSREDANQRTSFSTEFTVVIWPLCSLADGPTSSSRGFRPAEMTIAFGRRKNSCQTSGQAPRMRHPVSLRGRAATEDDLDDSNNIERTL